MSINIKYITRLVFRYKRTTNKSGCYHKTVDNNFGRFATNLLHVFVRVVRAERWWLLRMVQTVIAIFNILSMSRLLVIGLGLGLGLLIDIDLFNPLILEEIFNRNSYLIS